MKKIYIIADIHTVSAFRLSGVTGIVCEKDGASSMLDEVIKKGDAGIVAITSGIAEGLRDQITEINLGMMSPVVIEIPGINDPLALSGSSVDYIVQALGIAL